jgi:undecaprenyl-phosphate galactose phosphotransferase
LAVIFIVASLPLFLALAAAIWVATGENPIFRHRRIGFAGLPFFCFKFRTMRSSLRLEDILQSDPRLEREWAETRKLANDPRITWIGTVLRRTSLDELPQLFNVLRGDMSIVGPRPIVAEEVKRYGRWFAKYKRMKPGITGFWQVSGRNDCTYRRRVAADVLYYRRKSIAMDVAILLKTLPVVISGKGCY